MVRLGCSGATDRVPCPGPPSTLRLCVDARIPETFKVAYSGILDARMSTFPRRAHRSRKHHHTTWFRNRACDSGFFFLDPMPIWGGGLGQAMHSTGTGSTLGGCPNAATNCTVQLEDPALAVGRTSRSFLRLRHASLEDGSKRRRAQQRAKWCQSLSHRGVPGQPKKALSPTSTAPGGSVIELKDVHPLNALRPISVMRLGGSVISLRDVHM